MKTDFEIIKSTLQRATTKTMSAISSIGDYESQSSRTVREGEYSNCIELLKGTGLEMKDAFASEKQINFYAFRILEVNSDFCKNFVAERSEFYLREERKLNAKKERVSERAAEMRDVATAVAKELGITKKALFEGLKNDRKALNDLRFKGTYSIEGIKKTLNML